MSPPRPRNLLLIVLDEQRAPRPYDPPLLLRAQARLRAQGLTLEHHYTAATACAPSRASLFTGHYPSLHGVTQTDGLAKDAHQVRWLQPGTLPTLGDYLRAAGYATHYRGKWHVSHADLLDAAGHPLPTNDRKGRPLSDGVRAYQVADPLEPFGFSGWIGPEPHGADPANTGYVRDPLFAEQVVAKLAELGAAQRDGDRPFCLVASLVNPHDIVMLSPLWHRRWGFPWPDDSIPRVAPPPTADEDLSTKPRCQQDYVDKYWRMLMPQPANDHYRRFYYWLQAEVDRHVGRILDALDAAGLRESTLVIYTSDHGEMLGAHGGMHQKWHNAYEETVRVPLVISNPVLFPQPRRAAPLTSHVDLLPTICGLLDVDLTAAQRAMKATHSLVRPPVGRDLSALLRDPAAAPAQDECIYFMTDDQVSAGDSWLSFGKLKLPYRPVRQPAYVETVVAQLQGDPRKWKLSRYFDGRRAPDGAASAGLPAPSSPRAHDSAQGPDPDEHELYCLTDDPLEERNLASGSATSEVRRVRPLLEGLLSRCRAERRLTPG